MKKFLKVLVFCSALALPLKSIHAEDAQTINVGTGNGYPPYCYLDENGNPAGYDYEVLKAVDETLPQYEFDIQTFDSEYKLTALDTNKIQLLAHQMEKNPEREEQYLMGEEPYTVYALHIVTYIENDFDPQTIEDLVGKKVHAVVGDNGAKTLEEFNDESDEKIELVYGKNNIEVTINKLKNGEVDAALFTSYDVESINNNYGNVIKASDEPMYETFTYFMFPKGEDQLKADTDEALKQLKEDGVIEQLEQEFLLQDNE